MPKIVKVRNYSPPNLLENFSSNDISPASGNELGSADKYVYNAGNDLRLWLRFKPNNPEDLVNYDTNNTPTIAYEGTEDTQILTVYSSRMHSARFDNVTNQYAELTFPGGSGNNNILTFGDGATEDLPFSISLWFRKLPESDGTESNDYLFAKGKSDSAVEYASFYDPSNDDFIFDLFAGSNSDRQRIFVNASELSDNKWHHIVYTYDGRGTSSGAVPTDGMQIYIDGIVQAKTVNSAGSYTYMDGVSEKLFIGAVYDGGGGHFESDGNMAEFAIWAKELSLEEIKAIYNWTREDSVIKSGYTNLPPRVRLRDLDNRPGCYPTKHRMGDKDRSGKSNIFYEDLPVQFGNEIKDDFTNVPSTDLITTDTGFDSKKWVVSSGMTIRRESIQGAEGINIVDRCATFSGRGTVGKRFLRSSQKIRNPYRFYFELLQGPYQFSAILLNLRAGNPDETLKLQIATDAAFTSPVTVATYVPTPDPTGEYSLVGPNKKPRRIISLSTSDFPDLGQEYYFRFVQETFTNTKNVWAIANIEVEYANQDIRYPLLLDHADRAGNKIANSILGNTNISGSLTALGRSVKGVSDLGNPFQDFSEAISAFDETLVIENADDEFFNQGLDPDVYPGFTSPARSKTKFTIDLSTNEETTFGVTNQGTANGAGQAPGDDTSGTGQNYMVYWNKELSKWEPIGLRTLHGGNTNPALSFDEYRSEVIERAALGFGPIKAVFKQEESSGPLSILNDDLAVSYSKPVNTFLFPFGNQYVATGSQYILAEDLGITKPFLLEKVYIDFQAKLQFPGSVDNVSTYGEHAKAYSGSYLNSSNGVTRLSGFSARKLTFFLLRQFEDNKSINHTINIKPATSDPAYDNVKLYNINSGSSRELITYGQLGVFLTGSDYDNLDRPSIGEILNSKLSGDDNLIIENWDHDSLLSLTGSYSINFKARNSARYKSGAYFNTKLSEYALLQKNNVGRGDGSLSSNSRALVNGLNGEGKTEQLIADSTIGSTPHTKAEFIDLDSPYLIQPKDKLIFGWQYPPAQSIKDSLPIIGDSGFNNMTLFGKSKLHLYGSEIVENKEYHETVNQNLTSCAVYEHVIGDEKIVDQWQVAYRGELSGSVAGQSPFNYFGGGALGEFRNNNNAWKFAFNNDWTFDNSTNFYNNQKLHETLNKNPPEKRIGLRIVQGGRSSLRNIAIGAGSSYSNADGFGKLYSQYLVPIRNYITVRDQDRIYADSNIVFGEIFSNSTYGGINSKDISGNDPDWGISSTNPGFYSGLKPQYIFKSNHFGYYADMFKQGKDSKFEVTPRQGFTTGFDIVVNSESPISIKFVSGTMQEGPTLRAYVDKDIDLYLDEKNFQSSNLSTAATSSMPFIDDNQPHNRSYIEQEYIAVPIF